MTTGFVYHENYTKHLPGANHPEKPERVQAILQRLQQEGLIAELTPIVPWKPELEWLYEIHDPDYVAFVQRTVQKGERMLDTFDTEVSEQSFDVALLAVGGVLAAVDAVQNQLVRNAFCAVRPPGHHALRNHAMGFCIFNNVAIATRYAQKKYHLAKVLIIDWDVHHGNGSQDAFYRDDSVFYFSVHQAGHYPGTGKAEEVGSGPGTGYTLNVPIAPGAGDKEYLQIFRDLLFPAAIKFQPDFIFISAGFDTNVDDPLANMAMTDTGFADLTRVVCEIADLSAHGRIVSVLEGGYQLNALAKSVEQHLRVLKDWPIQ